MFTVWKFTSLLTGEQAISVRAAQPDDLQYNFAHQRILWRGVAASKQDALALAARAA